MSGYPMDFHACDTDPPTSMPEWERLDQAFRRTAHRFPDNVALIAQDDRFTYAQLTKLVEVARSELVRRGIRPADRVLIWHEKSPTVVALLLATFEVGAIAVPVDPRCSISRVRSILASADPRLIVCTPDRMQSLGIGPRSIAYTSLDPTGLLPNAEAEYARTVWRTCGEDICLILYTSGTTGTPRGVSIRHRNAVTFVHWLTKTLQVRSTDILLSFAPFQFDLSVFDLYGALATGAATYLYPEQRSASAQGLVKALNDLPITIAYLVPSSLCMAMREGGLLDLHASQMALRALLFAGEVFPIQPLRRLRQHLGDGVRLLNLYGPTETNVCTYYEVGHLCESLLDPVPIGAAACGNLVWAVNPAGAVCGPGEEGELVVAGPTVMAGYWGEKAHEGPYFTGDWVRVLADASFQYLYRIDDQIKFRGHRIELGTVERAIEQLSAVERCAIVVLGEGLEATLIAYLVLSSSEQPSLVSIRTAGGAELPPGVTLSRAVCVDRLPVTINGKVDRRELCAWATTLPAVR